MELHSNELTLPESDKRFSVNEDQSEQGDTMELHSKEPTLPESNKRLFVNVDQYLEHIGEFGKMQKLLLVMFSLIIMPSTYQISLLTFTGYNPSWRCTGLHQECNQTGIVFDISHQFYKERCEMENQTSWEFIQPKKFSIVTEWNLVCKDEELSYLANSVVFVGGAVGAIALSAVADRYGRKTVLFPSLAAIIMLGFVSGLVQHFWVFFVTRLLIGIADRGVVISLYVLATELVGPSYRALSGTIPWFSFDLAFCLTGLQAWLVPHWRALQIIVSAPYIFVLTFWKFVPESVRWLRANGKLEEAEQILRRAAKINGKPEPIVKLSVAQIKATNGTYMDLFRPWSTCQDTLILCYVWFVNGMVFFGATMAADNLGGNMYRDFILLTLVRFPADLLAIVLGNRYGRKPSVIGSTFLAAVAFAVVPFIPLETNDPGHIWARVTLGLLGKLFITISYDVMYVWSAEIYPTVVRSQGMGLMEVASLIGGAAAPWAVQWMRIVHKRLPFLLIGGVTIIASFLCFFLKETNGKESAELLNTVKPVGEKKMLPLKATKRTKIITRSSLAYVDTSSKDPSFDNVAVVDQDEEARLVNSI